MSNESTFSRCTIQASVVLKRDENGTVNTTTGDPREIYYYFDGMRVGDVSNDGTSDTDYVASMAAHVRAAGTGPFRSGADKGTAYADFDQSFDPVNGLTYASTSSRYTVQGGDTLASIAQAVWGDASLWYLIADVNGLDGLETLAAGRDLIIPNKVHNVHNTSDVYRVYDPNDAIGNNNPTTPTPVSPSHHHGGCGVFGQILLIAVAVAVAIALPEVAGTYFGTGGLLGGGVLNGVVTGAIASTVSQGVGVLTGIQDKFSFKGVALAAISGGVGGELSAVHAFEGLGAVAGGALRGLTGSLVSQGLEVATGLQHRLDWAGVAAAGVGAAANGYAGGGFAGGVANGLAAAGARSLITGTDFGDNILKVLPDVIGQTVGNALGQEIARWGSPSPTITADMQGLLNDGGLAGGAAAANMPVADASPTDGNAATWLAQQVADTRQAGERMADDGWNPGDMRYSDGPGGWASGAVFEQVGDYIRGGKSLSEIPQDAENITMDEALSRGMRSGFVSDGNGNAVWTRFDQEALGVLSTPPLTMDLSNDWSILDAAYAPGAELASHVVDELGIEALEGAASNPLATALGGGLGVVVGHMNKPALKGYPGIGITPNGGPTFARTSYLYPVGVGQLNIVNVMLTGSRRTDIIEANSAAGFFDTPRNYTWHHVDDFNPSTGTGTMELVETGVHRATYPHSGSVSQYEKFFNTKYKR